MKPEITLVYDADCPNADAARAALGQALVRSRLNPEWIEVDRAAPGVAKQLLRFGSPTILVDGEDVAGESDAAAAACCRIYQTDRGLRGIPPIEAIVTAIDRAAAAKNVGGGLISKATASGALGLAFASSLSFLCCLPIFSGAVGIGLAALAAVVGAWWPALSAASLVLLIVAVAQAMRGRGGLRSNHCDARNRVRTR